MKKKNPVIIGTIVLTATGIVTRLIGFFYRIFLSGIIGAEGMGIYQMIFPIFGICFSLCCGPIQTAISRFVAAEVARENKGGSKTFFYAGLLLSLALSFACSCVLFYFAPAIAKYVLMEERCTNLLKLLSLSIPLNAVHSCICGYYYGCKKTEVPAFSQLLEQLVRVFSVWLIADILTQQGKELTVAVAVAGMILGEFVAMLYTIAAINITFVKNQSTVKKELVSTLSFDCYKIFLLAAPLAANRLVLSVLQSAEAIMIPNCLRTFGLTTKEAFSIYGVFTGMAMPFILFPSTVTNSIAVMLLPDVAEAQSMQNDKKISRTTNRTIGFSLYIGILCTGVFILFGPEMGELFFPNTSAGSFIPILAWLCPFLYLTTTVGSIINGLGKTGMTFLLNLAGVAVRLLFVIFLVPRYGILAYLWGSLVSQLLTCFLHLFVLKNYTALLFDAIHQLARPTCAIALSAWIAQVVQKEAAGLNPFLRLALCCMIMCVCYLLFLYITRSGQISKEPTA